MRQYLYYYGFQLQSYTLESPGTSPGEGLVQVCHCSLRQHGWRQQPEILHCLLFVAEENILLIKNCLEVRSLDYPLTKSSQVSSILIILLYCDTGVIPSTQITQSYLRMRIIVVPLVIHVLCCKRERERDREGEFSHCIVANFCIMGTSQERGCSLLV